MGIGLDIERATFLLTQTGTAPSALRRRTLFWHFAFLPLGAFSLAATVASDLAVGATFINGNGCDHHRRQWLGEKASTAAASSPVAGVTIAGLSIDLHLPSPHALSATSEDDKAQ